MGKERLVRSSYGGARPRQDFPWLAREYLEGRLSPMSSSPSGSPLEQINDGFAGMAKGAVLRAVLTLT